VIQFPRNAAKNQSKEIIFYYNQQITVRNIIYSSRRHLHYRKKFEQQIPFAKLIVV
jgi:hypothetical protein